MRVSVIIPCYKDAATLGKALDSVFAQSRLPEEVIVVNDASPETNQIEVVIAAYPNVRYFVNNTNLGLAATRNAGVQAATGDVVSFLDADDELHPQKIELQLSVYRPGLAIACNTIRIGEERVVSDVEHFVGDAKYAVLENSSKLIKRNALTGASLMISRHNFLTLGGYDETLRSCEDFDLWLRILDAGIPALNIRLPLYLYRINEAGLSRNLINISFWELEVIKKYYARHRRSVLKRWGESLIFGLWLFKHLVRCEQCHDTKLLEITRRNIELVIPAALVQKLLLVAHNVGLARLCCLLKERKVLSFLLQR